MLGVNASGYAKRKVGEFLSSFLVKVTYPYMLDPTKVKVRDKLYDRGKFIPNVNMIDQQGGLVSSESGLWTWRGPV